MMMTLPTPYWQSDDGRATLYCGDCLELLPLMASGSVDAVVTDPPWMNYATCRYDASEWHAPIVKVAPTKYADKMFRVLRNNSAVLLWCRWEVFEEHAGAWRQVGGDVRNCIVWAKPNHTAGDLNGNLGYQHETAVFGVKGNWQRHGPRETNIWIEPHLFSRDKRYHPTEKPIHLMERCISLVCPQSDTILDPFAGSGTTGVACIQTGRRFVGIELSEKYCAIAARRLAAACCEDGGLFDPKAKHRASLFSEAV